MTTPLVRVLKRILKITLAFLFVILAGFTLLFFVVTQPPAEVAPADRTVNDVTGLNPIQVQEIKQPTSTEEIIDLVRNHNGPVSIGGARHSMGGQIGTEQSLHLDMRSFNKIVAYDKINKKITVQTGITWRTIQERIDGDNLSVKIMQTYANFTVGGSLSVNVHGRYIGQGPLIHSVKSLKIVLPDGTLTQASPEENKELFYGCIGGYGGLGVIVEATLKLTDNCRVARHSQTMPLEEYADYFSQNIRNDTGVVFHNADIYPNDFTEVRAVSFLQTNKPITIEDRLKPVGKNYRAERFAMWLVSEMPGGKWMRQHWADPLYYEEERVVWRNHEASFDALELEPTSRNNSTYVLQEYFVPVAQFNAFVPAMTRIFQQHKVNVINISIRHAHADPGSTLAWAPTEVFCFVVYYKQDTDEAAKEKVGQWTRELIDAAIAHGGSYYLPYQLHATQTQFLKAYPHAPEFFELKKKIDPQNKFRNKLWDSYYKPATP
jgi:FAD/FMN-containing dehydrogenase